MKLEPLRHGFDRLSLHVESFVSRPVLHRITTPDGDLYHSHPGEFQTFCLHGWYVAENLKLAADGRVVALELVRHSVGQSMHCEKGLIHRIIEVAPEGYESVTIWGDVDQVVRFYNVVDGFAVERIIG